MPTVDLFKIQKLYQEKRYSEAIFEIESTTTDKNRSSFLYNLLGVCRRRKRVRQKRYSICPE